jgi:hypothetical protein
MTFGDWARHFIKLGLAKAITREEALEVIRRNEEDGLVLQPNNYQKSILSAPAAGTVASF